MKALAAVCAISAFGLPALSGEMVLFDQQPAQGSALISISTGNNQFSYANRRRADNFSLSSDSTIDSISFWGGDESNVPAQALSNISGFDIEIYALDNNAPGAVLADFTVSLADSSPVNTGQTVGLLFAPMFEFSVDLVDPLALSSGDYFISIAANVISPVGLVAEAFQWAGSLPGDSVLYSDSFDGNGYTDASSFARTSTAFQLRGIPSPSGLAAFALVGLGVSRRRRR